MQARSRGPLYAIIAVLVVVLLAVVGYALWQRSQPDAPAEPGATDAPVGPGSVEPTLELPPNLPAPADPTFDPADPKWEGKPPPVYFDTVFAEPFPSSFDVPSELGEYVLDEDHATAAMGTSLIRYQGPATDHHIEVSIDAAPLTWSVFLETATDPEPVGVATCYRRPPSGVLSCTAIGEDLTLEVRNIGGSEPVTAEQLEGWVREVLKGFREAATRQP